MLVRSVRDSMIIAAYPVTPAGPHFCSGCRACMSEGEYYTHTTFYNPMSGKPLTMALCEVCNPIAFTEQPSDPIPTEQFPTLALQVVRANTPKPERMQQPTGSGWVRETPADISEVRTQRVNLETDLPKELTDKFRKLIFQQ